MCDVSREQDVQGLNRHWAQLTVYISCYVEAQNRDAFMAVRQDLMLAFVDCVHRNRAELARTRLGVSLLCPAREAWALCVCMPASAPGGNCASDFRRVWRKGRDWLADSAQQGCLLAVAGRPNAVHVTCKHSSTASTPTAHGLLAADRGDEHHVSRSCLGTSFRP